MKIFGIAGFKNAGKTTLVVALVRHFRAAGLRVATIKHAHHAFDIDHPGKDSFLHREAGAGEVIVASAHRWAHIVEHEEKAEPDLDQLLTRVIDADLVLVEGFKHNPHPKLEIRHGDSVNPLLSAQDESVRAIVCDVEVPSATVPVFGRNEIAAIADFILQQAQLDR